MLSNAQIKNIERKYDSQLSRTEKIAKFSLKHPKATNIAKLGFIVGCTALGAYVGQKLIGDVKIHYPAVQAHDEIRGGGINVPIFFSTGFPISTPEKVVHIPYSPAHDEILNGSLLGGGASGIVSTIAAYFRRNKDC